jgi:hypothetical protein
MARNPRPAARLLEAGSKPQPWHLLRSPLSFAVALPTLAGSVKLAELGQHWTVPLVAAAFFNGFLLAMVWFRLREPPAPAEPPDPPEQC